MHSILVWRAVVLLVLSISFSASAQEPRILQDHRGSVMALSFSPDRATLATCSRDGTIKLWDLGTDKIKATLTGHESDVYCVSFSPDGSQLASCSGDKTIRIWNAKTLQPVRTLTGHSEVVRWVAFSPMARHWPALVAIELSVSGIRQQANRSAFSMGTTTS